MEVHSSRDCHHIDWPLISPSPAKATRLSRPDRPDQYILNQGIREALLIVIA